MAEGPAVSTLTEFLLARIAEREDLARAAKTEAALFTGDPGFAVEWWWALRTQHTSGGSGISYVRSALPDTPDDVLADCDAKRRIVAEHHPIDPCDAHDASFQSIDCDSLRLLALPYADHPDYREEWR
jgi:hypothetical protein